MTQEQNHIFWTDFLRGLTLDYREQKIPNPSLLNYLSFTILQPGGIWIQPSRHINEAKCVVAVYYTHSDPSADRAFRMFSIRRSEIEQHLGFELNWKEDGIHHPKPYVERPFNDHSEAGQQDQIAWLRSTLNSFVNVFRPIVQGD